MINVVIVEDMDDYRNALRLLLNNTPGFRCMADYADAEACLKDERYKSADVALLDIQLPGKSGIQLVQQIRKTSTGVLCMMCTAYEEDEKIFGALQAGAHGYLLKISSPAYILEAIIELYNGGSPMSASVARKVVETFMQTPKETFALSPREEEILRLLAKGLLYKEIAARLNISTETVRTHCFKIYDKLHVHNRTEALNKFFGRK
ncbi:MAG: response regulator transcription factor [Flavihumibacter sp.]